ncbi:MAG: universal stress protein [Deltaproteobacteria bacterium]|nr:universal stress protein [Deltaproteobacteria bacterium]MBW2660607.1 universal stress protein [Deltaproteobacteria bacterium]
MKFKKMLFVTDFDELWLDALESLMELRKAGLNHVVFLHVINREQVAMHRGTGYLKEEDVKLKQMADVRFIDWAESVFEKGMECGAYVVVGNPLPKILSTAETEGVDLIITEAHKRTKLEKLFASSTTMELLQRSKTPVLVHKYMLPSGKVNDKPFDTPLLVTDWSSPCERALEQLIDIKKALKKVVVIHVVSDDVIKGKSKDDLIKIQRENKKRLEDICTTFKDEEVEAEFHLCMGNVVSQIETAAREYNATMIVMGATGKGAWRARWLGSVSRELTEMSEFPTLLVP